MPRSRGDRGGATVEAVGVARMEVRAARTAIGVRRRTGAAMSRGRRITGGQTFALIQDTRQNVRRQSKTSQTAGPRSTVGGRQKTQTRWSSSSSSSSNPLCTENLPK